MSVRKKDRNVAKNDVLSKVRKLNEQLLILIRPAEYDKDGERIQKPGPLGEGQPLQAFGLDIFRCGKGLHAACWQASKIYLKDAQTLEDRRTLYTKGLDYCTSILQQLDLCIHVYASNNKKKRKSFAYVGWLTNEVKKSLHDRMNRDNLIYSHEYSTQEC